MRKTSVLSLATLIIGAFTGALHAAPMSPTPYATGISAHKIAAIQRTITDTAIGTFLGTHSAVLGTRANVISPTPSVAHDNRPAHDIYGRAPMYGRPAMYGEYESHGRSGGDAFAHSMWLNWQHYDDTAKFQNMDSIDSDYDLAMIGLGGNHAQMGAGVAQWGIYGGYVGGKTHNDAIEIRENGGYVGLYGGYSFDCLNISGTVTGGTLSNAADFGEFASDEYVNLWLGMGVSATYNIALDDTFTLQPGVYGGYTWIQSPSYTNAYGDAITSGNFNIATVAPGVRAIKHIGGDWFGYIGAKYVFSFVGGGDMALNTAAIPELSINDYSEYGIGLEKSVNRFNLSVNLMRRDGGRSGWSGGFNMKYLF